MKKKSLVIFGCGYLGSAIARKAVENNFLVTALTRNKKALAQLKVIGVQTPVQAELGSTIWHSQINQQCNIVINCVSSATNTIQGYKKSYIDGQNSIAEWISNGHIDKCIYTSSTSVYPQNEGEIITENSPTNYAIGTGEIILESEKILSNLDKKYLNTLYILRLSGIYGPNRHYLLDQLKQGKNEFEGSCEHFLNLIHRDDICSAIWSLINSNISVSDEVFNLSDNNPFTKKYVINWLAEKVGCESPKFNFENNLESVTHRINKSKSNPKNRIISSDKIQKMINWQPAYKNFMEGYNSILN